MTLTRLLQYNHIHIDIRPPERMAIGNSKNILAESLAMFPTAGDLVFDLIQEFDVQESKMDMYYPVDFSESAPIVIVATAKAGEEHALGLCMVVSNQEGEILFIARQAQGYLKEYQENPSLPSDENVQIVKQPEHGQLTKLRRADLYLYKPDQGYLGKDRFEALVTMADGGTVRIVYNIIVQSEPVDNPGFEIEDFCPIPYWKISFSSLSNSALAQTTGTGPTSQITFDFDAAGHGWYIDYTPYLNEEYLPTSNPYEWIAKPGSEAEGKMDLLSVLWHELGQTNKRVSVI